MATTKVRAVESGPRWGWGPDSRGLTPCLSPLPPAGKYLVLFFYPLDFTFVCPTEIIAFSERAEDFRKLGCEVLGVSVDSQFTHLAWYELGRAGRGDAAKRPTSGGPSCVFLWVLLNIWASLSPILKRVELRTPKSLMMMAVISI